jgi:hypothetical protein
MKRWMVAVLGGAVTLTAVVPASALFIFHPLISSAIWGPHYAAYPPTVAYPPAVPAAPYTVVVPPVGSYEHASPQLYEPNRQWCDVLSLWLRLLQAHIRGHHADVRGGAEPGIGTREPALTGAPGRRI